jgi:type I restriction enzyme S subunit
MVPDEWELKTLEEVCMPGAPITYGVLKPGNFVRNGVPLLQIKDMRNGQVVRDQLHQIAPELDKEYKRSRIQENDILVSLVGTIGRVAKVERLKNANIHRNIGRVRSDMHEFLFHFLSSEIALREMGLTSSGSSQSALNLSTLRKMKVPVPPIPEQKKIAQILSTWEQAISATERLFENSQGRQQGLMQQLLTGKKRLPGFEGDWKEGHLKDISAISKGKALSSKDLEDGTFPVVAGGKTSPYTHKRYTHDHAITVSASGAYAGYVAYHKYKFWASDCSVVEATKASDIEFLYHLMKWNQKRIYSLQSGGAQPHIYPKDLHSVSIQIPEKDEQHAIANVLTTATGEIDLLKSQLDNLKLEKKALMQQLLTGKRRVKMEAF